MAEKFVARGIEKLRIGPGVKTATLPTTGMIDVTGYITPNSVVRTKNADTIERIIPDGKSVAYVTYTTPGNPDTIVISLLDQNPELQQLMSNVVYDAATTTITELAQRKLADICIEITTLPEDGKKCVITIPSVAATLSTADPLTYNNVEKFVINGELQSFSTVDGDAISVKKWVHEDGSVLVSTPA